MPNEHRADPTPPPHHGQGRGGSKKESSSLRVSPALHPPERPSPRRADIADHGLGRETRERIGPIILYTVYQVSQISKIRNTKNWSPILYTNTTNVCSACSSYLRPGSSKVPCNL